MSKRAQIVALAMVSITLALLFLPAIYLGISSGPGANYRAVELGQLDAALKQYKVLFREYPPNFIVPVAPQQHLERVFTRNTDTTPIDLDAAEALVFWLQGFSDDPIAPLTGEQRRALMQFDPTRLRDADRDGFPEYHPPESKVPYVYFHHDSYALGSYSFSASRGEARPYNSDDRDQVFVNDYSFQIICAGSDDHYGRGGSFPSGHGFAKEDWDNLANFSGGTLKSRHRP